MMKTHKKQKVGENIEFWTYEICRLVELDFSRLLSLVVSETEFGYESSVFGNNKGVIVIIGSDHGGGKSRFLIRTNYLDSSTRQKMNRVDHGTRTLQFAEVNCRKDTHDVHQKIAPIINKAIKELRQSKLIFVRHGKKKINVYLFQKMHQIYILIQSAITFTFITPLRHQRNQLVKN